jgi:hypothetical protein
MNKYYLIFSFVLLFNNSVIAQNTKSSPLFSCTELMKTIKNRADRTIIKFNGNTDDFVNDLTENVIKPGFNDYVANLFSNANRNIPQEEQEIIVAQSLECMKKINWDFNNSKKKESNETDEKKYFNFAIILLDAILRPSLSKSGETYSNSKQPSSTSEKKCSYCWKRQEKIRRFDLAKDGYVWDRDAEMRPGSVLCRSGGCGGSGRIVEGAFGSKSLRVCLNCNGSGWIRCNDCKGTGFNK